MIQLAWRVKPDAVIASPDWFTSDHFDIDGTIPPDTPDDSVRLMLQRFLASQFRLAVHLEQKPQDVFALTVPDGEPKLQHASGSGDAECTVSVDNGNHRADCANMSMADLADRLPGLASNESQATVSQCSTHSGMMPASNWSYETCFSRWL